MWAAQAVSLHAHNGRMLTRPEILIDQFHEMRLAAQKKLADEKMSEKIILSRISSKLIAVPSVKRDIGDVLIPQEKADFSGKFIDDNQYIGEGDDDMIAHNNIDIDDESVDEHEPSTKKSSRKRSTDTNSDPLDDEVLSHDADNTDKGVADVAPNTTSAEGTIPATSTRIKKKQRQSDVITKATEQDLSAIFSPPGLLLNSDWNTTKDPVMKEFVLDNFGYDKNNTVALKITVPPGSTRWSLNICPPNHFESTSILLHFNPRKGKKTELVMNDKQGTWGTAVKRSLSSLCYSSSSGSDSGLLGNSIELVIHIKREGFIVFVNRHFCVFFAHRREPEYFSSLLLTLPVLDDNGNEELAIYNKVWWGICDPSLPFHEIPVTVLLLASTEINPAGLRTVLVSGLPLLHDLQALQVLEGALISLFEEYCPEAVNVVPGDSGTAYVKLKEASHVEEFIEVFNGSTVGEDNEKQYTLELSKYDSRKSS